MAVAIRRGAFETNSSSEHTLTLLSPDQWQEICNGGVLVNEDISRLTDGDFKPGWIYDKTDIIAGISEDDYQELTDWWTLFSLDAPSDLDRSVERKVTPGGEEIVIVCDHGRR